eukprot:Amastigsp_a3537_18.p4 type:complete len:100 gc:universal Amastigsp_a3537_18:760-461(-)
MRADKVHDRRLPRQASRAICDGARVRWRHVRLLRCLGLPLTAMHPDARVLVRACWGRLRRVRALCVRVRGAVLPVRHLPKVALRGRPVRAPSVVCRHRL